MKNRLLLLIFLLSVLPVITACAALPVKKDNRKPFTKKDATTSIDAFHAAFYNPEMRLYAISSDMKGRAAIRLHLLNQQ